MAALYQVHNAVAHFRLNGAELVFHVDAVLFAESNEVTALPAQFTRQREHTDFLFLLLQDELPVSLST
jgi:hypothetical protein